MQIRSDFGVVFILSFGLCSCLVSLYLTANSGVIGIALKSRLATAVSLMTNTHADCMWATFFVHANGNALSATRKVWTTNQIIGTIRVAFALVWN